MSFTPEECQQHWVYLQYSTCADGAIGGWELIELLELERRYNKAEALRSLGELCGARDCHPSFCPFAKLNQQECPIKEVM